MALRKDHKVGDVFGNLTVIHHEFRKIENASGQSVVAWKCRCVCGREDYFEGSKLRNGWITSCGCLPRPRKILSPERRINLLPPGNLRAYRLWKLVRSNTAIKTAGYRDPSLDRWKEFYDFFAEMGPCPEGHKLGRKDLTKGFMPGNCVWELTT